MPLIDWNTTHRAGHGVAAGFVGWLRRDRWFTDRAGAERSPSQWAVIDGDYAGTSILGVINGILPRFGIVLVCHFVPETGVPAPPYLSFQKRWWEL